MAVKMTLAARWDWLAHVAKAMLQNHHTELLEKLRPFIQNDGIVVDVGAHSGQTAKVFARLARRGTVYAFEPGSYALSILRPAIWASRLTNIEIVPCGLSDKPSTAVLHMPVKGHGGFGFGLSNLAEPTGERAVVDEEVSLTTLDLFAVERQFQRLDFVKADIEGWELSFLRGGLETLERFRPTLMIEIVEESLRRADAGPSDIFDLLESLGYEATHMPRSEVVSAFDGDADYLFVPSKNVWA